MDRKPHEGLKKSEEPKKTSGGVWSLAFLYRSRVLEKGEEDGSLNKPLLDKSASGLKSNHEWSHGDQDTKTDESGKKDQNGVEDISGTLLREQPPTGGSAFGSDLGTKHEKGGLHTMKKEELFAYCQNAYANFHEIRDRPPLIYITGVIDATIKTWVDGQLPQSSENSQQTITESQLTKRDREALKSQKQAEQRLRNDLTEKAQKAIVEAAQKQFKDSDLTERHIKDNVEIKGPIFSSFENAKKVMACMALLRYMANARKQTETKFIPLESGPISIGESANVGPSGSDQHIEYERGDSPGKYLLKNPLEYWKENFKPLHIKSCKDFETSVKDCLEKIVKIRLSEIPKERGSAVSEKELKYIENKWRTEAMKNFIKQARNEYTFKKWQEDDSYLQKNLTSENKRILEEKGSSTSQTPVFKGLVSSNLDAFLGPIYHYVQADSQRRHVENIDAELKPDGDGQRLLGGTSGMGTVSISKGEAGRGKEGSKGV